MPMKPNIRLLIALSLTSALATLHAETLLLRDGRRVTGTFVKGDSREVQFLGEDGQNRSYKVEEIQSIAFKAAGPAAADGLRRRPLAAPPAAVVVPAGAKLTLRMLEGIDSDVNSAGQKFRASLDDPLVVEGRTVAERGADATVQVVRVEQSGRFTGRDEVSLELIEITVSGKPYQVASSYAEVASAARGKRTAEIVGGTAAVGAIIGAIAGGGKGAAIGATTGAGAGAVVQVVTRGQRVKIAPEARLDFALKQPLSVQ